MIKNMNIINGVESTLSKSNSNGLCLIKNLPNLGSRGGREHEFNHSICNLWNNNSHFR